MLDRIRRLFAPPAFEGDEDKTRAARLLNAILWINLAVWLLSASALPFTADPLTGLIILAALSLLGLAMLVGMHRGRVRLVGLLFSFLLWAVTTALLLVSGGVVSPMASSYLIVVIIAGLLAGGYSALAFAGLSAVAAVGVYLAETAGMLPPPVIAPDPLTAMSALIGNLMAASLLLYLTTRSIDEALGNARRYAGELEEERGHLEETVQERTLDLARRASYLEATAAIAQDAASVLDLHELLSRVVVLISDRFGFYHTGLFLLDPAGDWAVLQAASSEGGRRMLERGHRLQFGTGVVGYVAARGEHRLAVDVGQDAVFFDNPDLPETRSELALPLRARGEVIGVLDVQSREPDAFGEEDVSTLQTLADQVAVALDNARLFQQVRESVEAERRAYGELSREEWLQLLQSRPGLGYRYHERDVLPVDETVAEEIHPGEELPALRLPIRAGGLTLGKIVAHKPSASEEWTPEEVGLMEALADQVSVALDSARLYGETQRRATEERLVGEVTARIRETLDIETVLQTAVQEMRAALELAEVEVRMGRARGADAEARGAETTQLVGTETGPKS